MPAAIRAIERGVGGGEHRRVRRLEVDEIEEPHRQAVAVRREAAAVRDGFRPRTNTAGPCSRPAAAHRDASLVGSGARFVQPLAPLGAERRIAPRISLARIAAAKMPRMAERSSSVSCAPITLSLLLT